MESLTASAARAALPALLSRVEQGEEVTITRHGRPVAVLVSPDGLRARRVTEVFREAELVHALIDAAKEEPVAQSPGLTTESAEALIAHIRAGRDGS